MGYVNNHGYVYLRRPDHPQANAKGYVPEHRLVAELALGRPIPRMAHVHHVNGNKEDNRPNNLVVCEDCAYHRLLHQRERALRASGDANFRHCCFCGEYEDPSNGNLYIGRTSYWHPECHNERRRQRKLELAGRE